MSQANSKISHFFKCLSKWLNILTEIEIPILFLILDKTCNRSRKNKFSVKICITQ